jgi:F0F1-type ATP synthase assembly protein I
LTKGSQALLIVVLVTALVLTPLILGGVLLGFYLGDLMGYSRSVLAIAFSTAGFLAGMAIIFRVIRLVVEKTDGPTERPS